MIRRSMTGQASIMFSPTSRGRDWSSLKLRQKLTWVYSYKRKLYQRGDQTCIQCIFSNLCGQWKAQLEFLSCFGATECCHCLGLLITDESEITLSQATQNQLTQTTSNNHKQHKPVRQQSGNTATSNTNQSTTSNTNKSGNNQATNHKQHSHKQHKQVRKQSASPH